VSDAAKKVKRMFSAIGRPPRPEDVVGNLGLPAPRRDAATSREPMVQVNVRLPVSVKKKVRLLAARDGVSISDLILEAIELYEERHGAAPDV